MGSFAIKPIVQFLAWAVASVLVYLNLKMLTEEATSFFVDSDNIIVKIIIVLAGLSFVMLAGLFCILSADEEESKSSFNSNAPGPARVAKYRDSEFIKK